MIGVIGGSGFYSFLEDPKELTVSTHFGNATIYEGYSGLSNEKVVFIPRHGKSHKLPPSKINYRANLLAAHIKGVTKIYSTNAVGSSNLATGAGSLVVLDQILDMTYGRGHTFFDGSNFEITLKGELLKGVVHTDVSEPFDRNVREELIKSCERLGINCTPTGTIAVFNGPRYETAAEIKACTILGANYFGMTSAPEAFLAKEIRLPYATLAVVTNYAAGMQDSLSHDEVTEIFEEKIDLVKKIIYNAISNTNT